MNHGLGLVDVVRSGDWDDQRGTEDQRKEWVKEGAAVVGVAPPGTG